MDDNATTAAIPAPYFHEPTGSVRFWVKTDDGAIVGASITKETLHYRFKAELSGADAVAIYVHHHDAVDGAVRRRVAAGSIEPVMLRESDVNRA